MVFGSYGWQWDVAFLKKLIPLILYCINYGSCAFQEKQGVFKRSKAM